MILNDDNDESRRTVENCYRTRKVLVNPIVDWEDDDVWEFLNEVAKVPHCKLYDQGYTRLGCIGCPLVPRKQAGELEKYPKYKENYMRAFERMLKAIRKNGREPKKWKTAEDVYRWFVQTDYFGKKDEEEE